MGIISVEKADHLFWLGRYTERVFTTLRKFYHVYDKMIETQEKEIIYKPYCERLSIPDIYTDEKDFVKRYLFDEKNPDSMRSNMEYAYDNAVVLRQELSSNVLSYIELALGTLKGAELNCGSPLFQLQPVMDYLYAFWGCVDDYVDNEECRNIMKTGKYVERLDLYMRLEYHTADIEKEFSKMLNRVKKTQLHINNDKLAKLTEIINQKEAWTQHYFEALVSLGGIVEVL